MNLRDSTLAAARLRIAGNQTVAADSVVRRRRLEVRDIGPPHCAPKESMEIINPVEVMLVCGGTPRRSLFKAGAAAQRMTRRGGGLVTIPGVAWDFAALFVHSIPDRRQYLDI